MHTSIDMIKHVIGIKEEIIVQIAISWSCEKGFGILTIEQTIAEGKVSYHIDNECMDRDFIKEVLCSIVDKATLTSDK